MKCRFALVCYFSMLALMSLCLSLLITLAVQAMVTSPAMAVAPTGPSTTPDPNAYDLYPNGSLCVSWQKIMVPSEWQSAGICDASVAKFCIAYIGNHTPSTDTKKCPRDGISDTIRLYNNQICFYLKTKNAACATKYTLNGPDCYDIVNTGTPAGCAAPPQGIFNINISRNNYTQQCFYFKQSAACSGSYSTSADQFCVGYVHGTQPTADTAGTCTNSSFPYLSKGKCYSFATTKNPLKSPSGTTGQPATTGQCPAGPSGTTVDYDPTSNMCYYAVSGSTCTFPYQKDSTNTWCQAPPNDTFATTKSGLPPQPCPKIKDTQYVLKPDGNCAPSLDSTTSTEIGPTCSAGYIYDPNAKGCLANLTGAFTDTSDNCKLDTAKPPKNYVCKYTTAKATLTCTIVNQPSEDKSDGQIECLMRTGDAATGTVISHYVCDGVDTNYNPTKCYYYGNNSSRGTILAYSTCTTASSIVDCTIVTCILGGSTKPTYNEPAILGPPAKCDTSKTINYIAVTIDQSCSQFADGKPLTCTYGNSKSTKSRSVSIDCQSDSKCTVYNYAYSNQFDRTCITYDASSPSTCTIIVPGVTWKEFCFPPNPNSKNITFSSCTIIDFNSGTDLGKLTCDEPTTDATTCTITDENNNSMTITCNPPISSGTINTTCTGAMPECPDHATVTESTIACSAALIVDLFARPVSKGPVLLVFPLSQAELQFLLDAKELGISSQAWTSTTQNLPKVTYV